MSARDVVVIDSGGANLASLRFALERLGVKAAISTDADRIRGASHVLLPGVGAAHDAMARLRAAGLDRLIPTLRQPLLGICLGMQLLFETSEEAAAGARETAGLAVIPGTVRRMPATPEHPVPHMGWNQLWPLRADPLFEGIAPGDYMYFVHSYAAPVTEDTLVACLYGARFAAAIVRGNFRGVQFHPERSAAAGARLLANFLGLAA
ncbi:MAG TPA: imidazole glycerol phosphate synthase subunit HisH [Steroidobacteraceae bacterium]|nr:imidazole glycerol phosphate synthase subunit HisH [Steroidobacteraceae bacterium]